MAGEVGDIHKGAGVKQNNIICAPSIDVHDLSSLECNVGSPKVHQCAIVVCRERLSLHTCSHPRGFQRADTRIAGAERATTDVWLQQVGL